MIEEVDESGKWIDNARKAANELRNSQKPHLIIALLKSGAIQVSVQKFTIEFEILRSFFMHLNLKFLKAKKVFPVFQLLVYFDFSD